MITVKTTLDFDGWRFKRDVEIYYLKISTRLLVVLSLLRGPAPCCHASACAMFSKAFQGLKCFIANVMC